MTDIWDDDTCSSSRGRTVDTHINTLRKKLGAREWIVTMRGVGFMMGVDGPDPIVLASPEPSVAHSFAMTGTSPWTP